MRHPSLPITRPTPQQRQQLFFLSDCGPEEAPLWTPADIDTDLWLDAADESTFTLTGSAIDEWRDKSGNGRHYSGSGASRPSLVADRIGGLPAVVPDGVDDYLAQSAGTGSGGAWPCTIAVMYHAIWPYNGSMLGGDGWPNRSFGPGLNAWAAGYYPNVSMYYQTSTGAPYIAIGESATNDHKFFVDGVQRASSTSGTAAPLSPFQIGRHPMFGAYGVSRVGEIVVIPGRDTAVRQKLEGYLAHKWGRLAVLPVDHPYKVNPPTK